MSACIREIQVPLADLCGLRSIIPNIKEGAPIYHYAKTMHMCGLLLADMIENMRIYYILSSDTYEVVLSTFVIRAELLNVWKQTLAGRFDNRSFHEDVSHTGEVRCEITVNVDVPSGIVESDKMCVVKIFTCLLANAIRFTLEGMIHVEMYTSTLDIPICKKNNNTTMFHLVISDTGIGVPETARDLIFQPLTKAHPESIHGGVGMGLPVSRAMCEVLGGSLVLENSGRGETSGSIFHAQFPIYVPKRNKTCISSIQYSDHKVLDPTFFNDNLDEHGERSSRETSVVVTDFTVTRPGRMPLVLFVDDVKLNQIIVSKYFADVSITVKTADNGYDAIYECKNTKFDVILMDIIMPKMGGIEAMDEIRKGCPMNKETPVVALTGSHTGDIKKDCLKRGMVDYLNKPVRRKHLVETVTKYVKPEHRKWIIDHQVLATSGSKPKIR